MPYLLWGGENKQSDPLLEAPHTSFQVSLSALWGALEVESLGGGC